MEFKKLMLKDVIKNIFSGGTPRTGNPEYWDGDLLWLSSGETRSRYITTTEKKITKKAVEESSTRLTKENSIVIASAGQGHTRGQTSFLLKPMYINQSVIAIEADPDIVLSKYLFYNISGRYRELRHISDSSSSRGSLTGKILKDLPIDVPPLKIQNNVVNFIDSVDKRIELNKKIIANLEELSQTLFKRWFIDFEFPDENGNPYISSGGKMKNIGKEEIPINWDKGYLSKYIEGTRSGDWGKETPQGNYVSEVTIIRGADIPPLKTGDLGNPPRRFILEKNTQSKKLSVGDIIVEISGGSPTQSTGRTLYINKKLLEKFNTPVLCTNFCRILRPKNIDFGIWIEFYFSYLYKSDLFFNFENGTTGIKNFDYNSLINKFEIFTPDDSTIFAFSNLVNQIYKTIQSYGDENIKLSKLRDTLLPKLMSGEIELPDELEVDEHAELLQ